MTLQAIQQALSSYALKITERGDKPWFKHVDVAQVMDHIMAETFQLKAIDGYLILYEIAEPWYNQHVRILNEVMVLQVYPGGQFSSVVGAMVALAREADCVMIHVGTALAGNDEALARKYKRHGFRPASHGLTLEL